MASEVTRRNQWWADGRCERYWMESLIVDKWGHQLIAPATANYAVMHLVEPGDIVFHWLTSKNIGKRPAGLYGWSRVTGTLNRSSETWGPRTTNVIPLSGYTPFDRPVSLDEIREVGADLMAILAELKSEHPKPYYFPWDDHPNGVKPAQKYLTKVPAKAVALLQCMRPDIHCEGLGVESISSPMASTTWTQERCRYAGFCADPDVRHAIELQAVAQARTHYEAQGYVVEDVGATRSYDLHLSRGDEERHVEVKGSQNTVQAIVLTRNEVKHANSEATTDLVIVESVGWARVDGRIWTRNGKMTVRYGWIPANENLAPLNYQYFLP